MKLRSNTILITGGGSGIGYELTKQLTALGNTILITGRDQAKMDRAKAAFPKIHTFRSDVSDPKAIANLYEEAIKQFPDNSTLGLQRAECLLLSDQSDNALPLWRRFHSPANPSHLAAMLICEMIGSGNNPKLAPACEKIVSQQFLTWYRRLLNTRADRCIRRLNGSLSKLSAVLPTAANFLATVLSEARQASA